MKNTYTAHMIISSAAIIMCSIINFIFTIIRKTLFIFNTISEMALSNFDYTNPKTWKDVFITAANAKAVFTLSFNALSILQFICGVFGTIVIILIFANKLDNKTKYLIISLFVIGIITSIVSISAYLLLIVSRQSSFFICFILLFTMPAISVIFTRYTKKLYLNYKTNAQYHSGGN